MGKWVMQQTCTLLRENTCPMHTVINNKKRTKSSREAKSTQKAHHPYFPSERSKIDGLCVSKINTKSAPNQAEKQECKGFILPGRAAKVNPIGCLPIIGPQPQPQTRRLPSAASSRCSPLAASRRWVPLTGLPPPAAAGSLVLLVSSSLLPR